jgi:hypothetical protein
MLEPAKVGYAEYHRAVVERIVNAYLPAWLLRPQSGEFFNNLDYYHRRLCGYSMCHGYRGFGDISQFGNCQAILYICPYVRGPGIRRASREWQWVRWPPACYGQGSRSVAMTTRTSDWDQD